MLDRVATDCRMFPSESNCSLYISGTPDEVLAAAMAHAVSWHRDEATSELEQAIKTSFQVPVPGA